MQRLKRSRGVKMLAVLLGIALAAFLLPGLAAAKTAPPSHLVGWWKLDDGSGTTAVDSSVYGNTGTLTGTPVWSANYPASAGDGLTGSLDFSSGSYGFTATLPTDEIEYVSISAWVYWYGGASPANQMIAYLGNSNSSGYGLYLRSGIPVVLVGGVGILGGLSPITPNTWNHVVATEDGGGNWRLYLNGLQAASGNAYPQPLNIGSDQMLIGLNQNVTSEYFNGLIDDVQVDDGSPSFSGGDGSPGDPFQIATAGDLNSIWIDETRPYYYELTQNVDLSVYSNDVNGTGSSNWTGWDPIGDNLNSNAFEGTFEGNGHTISNLYIDASPGSLEVGGLFGYIDSNAVVDSVYLDNVSVNIDVGASNGGLAGCNSGSITNCYATGTVSGNTTYSGGLVGFNSGSIAGCYATSSISEGGPYSGGLVGYNNGPVTGCYATGSVGGISISGGLVGLNSKHHHRLLCHRQRQR